MAGEVKRLNFSDGVSVTQPTDVGVPVSDTYASDVADGIVSTSAQTFAGDKTFADSVTVQDKVTAEIFQIDGSSATISSGGITVSSSMMQLSPESGTTDSLGTISGGEDGMILILHSGSSSHTITIQHNTGNIRLAAGADFDLDNARDTLMLVYKGGGTAAWIEIARSSNS